MIFRIDKTFEFDYGHRVWTQKLNKDFSLDSDCVCKHLHGHRAQVKVYLESSKLNKQGMVTDFKHLNWFKKALDEILDHKFIIDIKDPLLDRIIGKDKINSYYKWNKDFHCYLFENQNTYFDGDLLDYYSGFVITTFVPTSEHLAQWLFHILKKEMKSLGVKVAQVDFFETPKSKSSYGS